MFEHRFRHLLIESPVTTAPPSFEGFAVCPSPVAQSWSSTQQGWVAQLYRIAYERAQAQLHTLPRYLGLLTTSWN